jgi:hypothetical protein
MKRFSRRLIPIALGLLFLASCNGSSSGGGFVVPPSPVLLRFIQGSPSSGSGGSGTVDVCIDTQPFGGGSAAAPQVNYGSATAALYLVAGPKMISVYAGIGAGAGAECATAPAAYLGVPPIATAVLPVGSNVRRTIVLGGTSASGTLGLYTFAEQTYTVPPGGFTAVSHNAAPVFSTGKANGVGFGICWTTVTPCSVASALTGAQGVAVAVASTASAAVLNTPVASAMSAIPAGLYNGIGVPAGNPVPITSVSSPSPLPFQAYVVQLYAIDGPAGGLNLVKVLEQTTGFGF